MWIYGLWICGYGHFTLKLLRWFIKSLLLSADLLKLQVKRIKAVGGVGVGTYFRIETPCFDKL